MTTWHDIAEAIELEAPLALQEDYDNSGLQVEAAVAADITDIVITLDVTEAVVEEAARLGAQMVVSHHPLLFRPLRKLTAGDYVSATVRAAVRHDITLYAAHTNLDNAPRGVNDKLASVLQLQDLKPLVPMPSEKLQRTKLSADDCARCGSGLIGKLPTSMTADRFVVWVKDKLHAPYIKYNVDAPELVERVAICGGAGGSFISAAVRGGADAYVTGEVGYHPFFGHHDLLIAEAGHFETEQYTAQLLCSIIEKNFPGVRCHISAHLAAPTAVK